MKANINKILIYVICGLLAVILFCTITSFISGKASWQHYRRSDPSAEKVSTKEKLYSFKEIGTLRALTKPEEDVSTAVNVVITPWFAYETNDSAFIEELSHKKQTFKTIILNYISKHTKKELFSIGEKEVKEELLEQINQELVISKIKSIYFEDYIFLD